MKKFSRLILTSSALLWAGLPWAGSARADTAVRTDAFLDSIGVCTHITQGVDDPAQVAACLAYAGIRNVRDDGPGNPATLQAFIALHRRSGVKICLLPIDGNIARSLDQDEKLAAAGALLAAEGPNEPNNAAVTYLGNTSSGKTALPTAQFQAGLYRAVKGDPKLAGIPVFDVSEGGGSEPDNVGLQFLAIPPGAGVSLMPVGTVYADYANTHNYVCAHGSGGLGDNTAWQAEDPSLPGKWDGLYSEYGHTWWASGYTGYPPAQLVKLPRVTTETGWVTHGTDAITEQQQGRLFLNLYLDACKRGWAYTFIYMLRDDPAQGDWGLFHTDYTPKPSATYLHHLNVILTGKKNFAPGSFDYAIANQPATVHDLLLQRDPETYDLAVWDEKATGQDPIVVDLPATCASVKIYDPTLGTTPTQTLTGIRSVPLTLSDHPLILEIHAPARTVSP